MTEFKYIGRTTAFVDNNEVTLRFSNDTSLDELIDGFNAFLKAMGYESQVEVKE